jgi:hypothetical protein
LSAWFLFFGDLNTNVDFSNFIFVKIYSKFDFRNHIFQFFFYCEVISKRIFAPEEAEIFKDYLSILA